MTATHQGSILGRGKRFFFSTASSVSVDPTHPLIQHVPGALSLEVKEVGHEANHLHTCSTEVKNTWRYTSTTAYAFMS
jgi:hypothetical protein